MQAVDDTYVGTIDVEDSSGGFKGTMGNIIIILKRVFFFSYNTQKNWN
jgi:hypothetical protein